MQSKHKAKCHGQMGAQAEGSPPAVQLVQAALCRHMEINTLTCPEPLGAKKNDLKTKSLCAPSLQTLLRLVRQAVFWEMRGQIRTQFLP